MLKVLNFIMQNSCIPYLLCFMTVSNVFAGSIEPIPPTNLLTEYRVNPHNLDIPDPRFSWIMNDPDRGEYQTAYQILVASSERILSEDRGDVWDSGKVKSDRSVNVVYAGKPLESETRYYWKVRVWDKDDLPGAYGKPASFGMALLHPVKWKGKWIGDVPFIAKPIKIKKGAHIGVHSVILPGVTVGRGSVIGAGSVVTTDIPAYTIAVGVPAKVIKRIGKDGIETVKK